MATTTSHANPHKYNGNAKCLKKASFGKVHGTAAAIGMVELDGIINSIQLGSVHTLQIGYSKYTGFVSRYVHDQIEKTTTLTFADWRDILHDHWYFAAFNMQEEDGRIWHLLHQDWKHNIITPVAREIDQHDFTGIQGAIGFDAIKIVAGQKLLSAAEILNLVILHPVVFKWSAEPIADTILKAARPMNMNFQTGAKVIDVVNTVLDACGLQFTVRVPGEIYITLKGFSSNLFVNGMIDETIDPCILDPDEYSVGKELSEKGRRVTIVGSRNKYQYTFPCKADWNPNWTWELCYGGWVLSALLEKNGLTRDSKLKDMPLQYQDPKAWHETQEYAGAGHVVKQRTRNDLTVREYLDKVCFKIYVLDFSKAISSAEFGKIDDLVASYVPFEKWKPTAWLDLLAAATSGATVPTGPGIPAPPTPVPFDMKYPVSATTKEEIACPFPPSKSLVTDSNIQFIALGTSRKIINGIRNPFADQRTLIPMTDGVSLTVEDVITELTYGKFDKKGELIGFETKRVMTYIVRLIFDAPRFYIDRKVPFTDSKSIKADFVACVLSLDGDIFMYHKGDTTNSVKLRTQKLDVSNLYTAKVNDHGVVTLADNLRKNLGELGAIPALIPAKATDIAEKIATQALFHLAVNKSGSLSFSRPIGFECDGLIDTVQLELTETEITESIQLSDGWLEGEKYSFPMELGISAKMKFEGELATDRLKQLAKLANAQGRGNAASQPNANFIMQMPGSVFNPAATSLAFSGGPAQQGTAKVKVKKDIIAETPSNGLNVSQVMVFGKMQSYASVDKS